MVKRKKKKWLKQRTKFDVEKLYGVSSGAKAKRLKPRTVAKVRNMLEQKSSFFNR